MTLTASQSEQDTQKPKEHFHKLGFCTVKKAISATLLAQLREFASSLEADVLQRHKAGEIQNSFTLEELNGTNKAYRIDSVYSNQPELILHTIASPAVLATLLNIIGRGCVPMGTDLQFKYPNSKFHILWHQDAVYERCEPYINMGIYLDDAEAGDGCLRCVPGSHREAQDIYGLSKAHGWQIPGAIEVPAKAGDIIIHDGMMLHSSAPKYSPGDRRTLYMQFCGVNTLKKSGFYSQLWIDLRKQWMDEVLEQQQVEIWPKAWRDDYRGLLKKDNLYCLIRDRFESGFTGVWAYPAVKIPDYPV